MSKGLYIIYIHMYIYILYIIQFYSTLKKEKVMTFSDKWIKMGENIILSQVIQTQKDKRHIRPKL